jgi:hypothetical protein
MVQAIINFLTFNALNTPPEIYYGLAFVWLLLLGAGIASVLSRQGRIWLKLLWLLVLIGLPVVGLLIYSIVCVITADYGFLRLFGLHRRAASYLVTPPPPASK